MCGEHSLSIVVSFLTKMAFRGFCSSYTYTVYIYISGVKISALTREINFFQINALKIFNAVNAGAGLGLATPFTTAASVSFSWKGLCLFRCRTSFDHINIKRETFQTRALMSPLHQARVKRARKRHCARSVRSLNIHTKVPAHACIISYQQRKKLRACNVLVMPSVKAWSYQKGD